MVKPHSHRIVSSFDNSSEFFKVYLPSLSSKQLSIPPTFIRRLNGTIPNKANVKDHAGRLWHVRLEEVEGSVFIRNGWQAFASEHSLEHGDFLIFNYDGKSLFDVKIFGRHGCRKDGALATNEIITEMNKEKETEEEQKSCKPTRAYKRKYSEIVLKRTEKSGSSGKSRHKSRTVDLTNLEEPEAMAAYAKPKNPHFVSYINKQSLYVMYIPRFVLRSQSIELKPDMMLCDQNGKKWPVEICFKKDGRIFITTGWLNFRKKNKLVIKDKCIFEFLLTNGNVSKEMQVQVVRAGAATHKDRRLKA